MNEDGKEPMGLRVLERYTGPWAWAYLPANSLRLHEVYGSRSPGNLIRPLSSIMVFHEG